MILMLMTDAWWSGANSGMIGGLFGAGIGILGGFVGSLVGILAPRGVGRSFVLGGIFLMILTCVLSLITGLFALLLAGQPWHVWYPLVLLGAIGIVVFGCLFPVVTRLYRHAEQRQLEASALRGA
jgi:Ca2+/Na+ antiporter